MIIPPSKGLIALDIDGTMTAEKHIPKEMIDYLTALEKEGWFFAFITGRPFSWAYPTISSLPFSSLFAIQNGALLLELPSKKILNSHYLHADMIPTMESICKKLETDFVIYSGYENADVCYYRSQFFAQSQLDYLINRAAYLKEKWIPITSFSQMPTNNCASFKCFASQEKAYQLSLEIEKQLGLHAPSIKDPYGPNCYIVQATHPLACKGKVVQDICQLTQFTGPIIAAGNDNNDFGMLTAATIKIAMADAPDSLLAIADIIAPPATEMGLIQGLEQALNLTRV